MNGLDAARKVSALNALRQGWSVDAPGALCSFDEDSWTFDYFHHCAGHADLAILFPSALVRGKRLVPSFHRWSWAPNLAGFDVLCVSDPTLRLNDELLGGWFQGRHDDWVLLRTLRHIRDIQLATGYRRIVFCGSSLGGYAALQSGIVAPSLGFDPDACRVLAENPQVSLHRYLMTRHMNLLASSSYDVPSLKEVPDAFHARLDVVALIREFGVVPSGLVVVKESDPHHHLEHFNYLQVHAAPAAGASLRFEVIPASVDATGHTPLLFPEMSTRLATIFD